VLNGTGDQCGEGSDQNERQNEGPVPAGKLHHQDNGRDWPLSGSGQNGSGAEQREQSRWDARPERGPCVPKRSAE